VEPSTSRPARFALAIFSPLPRAFLISPRKDPFSARKWVHDFFPEPPPGPAQSVVTSSTASPLDCTLQSANATHCDCLCPPTHLRHDSYHRPAAVVRTCPPRPQPPVCVPAAGRGRRLFLCEKARTRDARTQFLLAHRHGEIDLIGGHKGVLCFVVIKSRTTREVKPAEAAVDGYKRQELFACRPRNTCATCHLRARGASKLLACSQTYRPLKCSRMFPSWRKMSLFASFCGKDFSNCLNLEKTQS
jgi:hypothetical protein